MYRFKFVSELWPLGAFVRGPLCLALHFSQEWGESGRRKPSLCTVRYGWISVSRCLFPVATGFTVCCVCGRHIHQPVEIRPSLVKGNCIWSFSDRRFEELGKKRHPTFSLDSFGSQSGSLSVLWP